jgi:hypothetical protein
VIGGEPARPAAAFDFARAGGGPCCASAGDWAASASTSRPITSHPAFPGGVTRACLASRLLSMEVDSVVQLGCTTSGVLDRLSWSHV